MNNKCLSEGFFSNLDTLYENCYRINPKPNKEFLDKMQLIEIQLRSIQNILEDVQAKSYHYHDIDRLTDDEKLWLSTYDKSSIILDEFMPYITAAFTLSSLKEDISL